MDARLKVLGVLSLALWAEFVYQGSGVSPSGLVVRMLVLFVVYAAAVGVAWRRPTPLVPVLVVAVLLRMVAVIGPPLFENDFYRYLWEGKAVAVGHNPYLEPPESASLESLRDGAEWVDIWIGVGYDHIPAAYPPLALGLFAALHRGGLGALKAAFILADVGVILLLVALLRSRAQDPGRVILYAWCPLPLKEVAGSAHYDPVATVCVLLVVWLLDRDRPMSALTMFCLACGLKLWALLVAPALFGRRTLVAWTAGVGTLVLLYLPFINWAEPLATFGGLRAYLHLWEFNASVFSVVRDVAGRTTAEVLARLAVLVAMFLCLRRGERDLGWAATILLVYLLTGPVIDPWYMLWLLPFLVFQPYPWAILWVGLVPLSYLYYLDQSMPLAAILAEYLPVYGLLAWWLGRRFTTLRDVERGHPAQQVDS